MLLRTPWSRGRRSSVVLPREPQTAAEIRARRQARALDRTSTARRHADGSHCHHCPEDS